MTQKVGEETFILVLQITSSLCLNLFRLSIDISHYIFGFFQTDRKEDKWFCMGDKLAHQKVLNKEWNNCTLGYMFRSHGWTLQVLATSHLEAWWWMALMYIRYRYSTTQLKWLSENRLTRFKAKKYGFKNGSNKWNSFVYKSIIYFVSHFHTYIKLYNKWITTRYFKKCD